MRSTKGYLRLRNYSNMSQVKTGARKTFHWRKSKYHVVAFFDDGEEHVVIKKWNRYRQGWHYEVWPTEIIEDKIYGTDKSENR